MHFWYTLYTETMISTNDEIHHYHRHDHCVLSPSFGFSINPRSQRRWSDLTHSQKKEKQNRNQAPKSNGIQTAFVGSNFGIAVGRDCSLSDLWIGLHCLASFHLVQLDNVIIFEACATLLHFLWSYLFHIDRPNQLFESLLLYEFWFSYICQSREGQRKTVFLVHII